MQKTCIKNKNIVYYKHPQQEESTDMMQFLSMIFGICSFMFRVKWGIWLALLLYLSSYVNLRYCQDQKNFIMNFSLIMMGFFLIYFGPQKGLKKQANDKNTKNEIRFNINIIYINILIII